MGAIVGMAGVGEGDAGFTYAAGLKKVILGGAGAGEGAGGLGSRCDGAVSNGDACAGARGAAGVEGGGMTGGDVLSVCVGAGGGGDGNAGYNGGATEDGNDANGSPGVVSGDTVATCIASPEAYGGGNAGRSHGGGDGGAKAGGPTLPAGGGLNTASDWKEDSNGCGFAGAPSSTVCVGVDAGSQWESVVSGRTGDGAARGGEENSPCGPSGAGAGPGAVTCAKNGSRGGACGGANSVPAAGGPNGV